MGRSVFEIEQWPASHVDEWRQFYTMRPFGAWRDNWHMAQLADMLARVNGNTHIPISHYFYMDAEAAAELRKQEDLKKFMAIEKYVEMKGG